MTIETGLAIVFGVLSYVFFQNWRFQKARADFAMKMITNLYRDFAAVNRALDSALEQSGIVRPPTPTKEDYISS